ncbi:MAG TPA: WG repeat-containing protein [Bacteroidales bacterium]|nr:WG repeat-containing protein [Bacteroidales bacterium]
MKRRLHFFAILIAICFISSCGGGSKGVSEIKLIPVESGDYYQYIDREGKIAINPQFSRVTIFRDGLALVRSSYDEPKWGFISEDGLYAIAANYKDATVFGDGLAWVISDNAPPTAINTKGKIQFTLQNAEIVNVFKEGLAAFCIMDTNVSKWGTKLRWGFVDKTGQVKIDPQFLNTGNFSDGKCAVEFENGGWGYIDKKGKTIIDPQFIDAKEFIDGKAVVFSDGGAGVINKKGKYVIKPQFSFMVKDGDKYLIRQNRKFGWCDKKGKIIINPQFEEAFPFRGGKLAAVRLGEKWGYIDSKGKIVINPQFDKALPYVGKLALVKSDGKYGLIDADGNYEENPQFDGITEELMLYMFHGSCSDYESVQTDLFNVIPIVKRINVNTPEGLSLYSKISDITTELYLGEHNFSKYWNRHTLINDRQITYDAEFTFSVFANAYEEVDGDMIFNPNADIQGYAYRIDLSGRGNGKAKDLKDAMERSLSGYKKDNIRYTEAMSVFKNEKQTVILYVSSSSSIVIGITSNQNEAVLEDIL